MDDQMDGFDSWLFGATDEDYQVWIMKYNIDLI